MSLQSGWLLGNSQYNHVCIYCCGSLLCSEIDKLYQANSADEASQAGSFKGSRKRMLVTLHCNTAHLFLV